MTLIKIAILKVISSGDKSAPCDLNFMGPNFINEHNLDVIESHLPRIHYSRAQFRADEEWSRTVSCSIKEANDQIDRRSNTQSDHQIRMLYSEIYPYNIPSGINFY